MLYRLSTYSVSNVVSVIKLLVPKDIYHRYLLQMCRWGKVVESLWVRKIIEKRCPQPRKQNVLVVDRSLNNFCRQLCNFAHLQTLP